MCIIRSCLQGNVFPSKIIECSSLWVKTSPEEEEEVVLDDVVVAVDELATIGGSNFRFLALGGSHCDDCDDAAAAKAA